MPQAAAGCFSVSTVQFSFAIAMAGAFAALRRPSRGRQAAPSALPGPAPAPLAAARCLHSLSLPDGPASIRSCSTPPLAASMPLVLEGLTRSASGDGASPPRCGSFIFCSDHVAVKLLSCVRPELLRARPFLSSVFPASHCLRRPVYGPQTTPHTKKEKCPYRRRC